MAGKLVDFPSSDYDVGSQIARQVTWPGLTGHEQAGCSRQIQVSPSGQEHKVAPLLDSIL